MRDLRLTGEQVAIARMVRGLMEERVAPRAQEIDRLGEFPVCVADLFRRYDVFAAAVPEEYGGVDGRLVTLCVVCEEIARVCASSSMIPGVQALGAAPIALFGSDAQKERWLPRAATGEKLLAFALTEPDAGSDVKAMTARAAPIDGGWRIDGRKSFISHANVADALVVFARVKTAEGDGITAFIVETDRPGFEVDRIEHKMGLRGSPTCSLVLEGVEVPEDAVVGGVGRGMEVLLQTLYRTRTHTAAQALGIAQGALDRSSAYVAQREQFGRPLSELQAVQLVVGRMATEVEAARALVYSAAARVDAGAPGVARFSAMAKTFASDVAMQVTTDAVQIMGGYGYMVEYEVERMMRDAKVCQIFEGANELHRVGIARDVFAQAKGPRR